MRISVYIATSLDGYIARPNGDIEWLERLGNPGESEDYGYGAFMNSVDCLVIGRNTFEKVLSFPKWPYENKRIIVLSSSLKDVPEQVRDKVELHSGDALDLASRLEAEGCTRIYVDGGKTIQSFLREGLITDIILTRVPILIGEGLPLFGSLPNDVLLQHVKTESFASGFVQSTYEVLRN